MTTDNDTDNDTDDTMERGQTRVQFYFGRAALLRAALNERTEEGRLSVSDVAKRDLGRYYDMLRLCLPAFSEEEASLLVDALNGIVVEPHTAALLWAQVDDAISAENLAEKWGVDGLALVTRLRALTPFEALAVEEAVERYWAGDYSDRAAGLRRVGLVRAAAMGVGDVPRATR